jgi:hypothetical protein
VFDLEKGRIFKRSLKENDRKSASKFWKIKDPFIKELNYGTYFMLKTEMKRQDKKRIKLMVKEMQNLILAVKDRNLQDWMFPVNEGMYSADSTQEISAPDAQ